MLSKIDPSELTPMMKQYYDIKKKFKDSILLFRLGDFYEMFFDDAILASKELEIVLTSRECGLKEKAPMCGIPHHTADTYINRLVDKGYRVALCEQLQDPKDANGLVERGVVRVISPGMNLEGEKDKYNNYLLSIFADDVVLGFSYIDISTGDIFFSESIKSKKSSELIIQDEIAKIKPSEIIVNSDVGENVKKYLGSIKSVFVSYYNIENKNPKELITYLQNYFQKRDLDSLKKKNYALLSMFSLINYVYSYEKLKLKHFKQPKYIASEEYLYLDAQTRKNLDVSINESHNNSLMNLLDQAVTPMGSRLFNEWIESPLLSKEKILIRQEIVSIFFDKQNLTNEFRSILSDVYDVERILAKLSYSRANARDLNSLKNSLNRLPEVKSTLLKFKEVELEGIVDNIDDLADIVSLIDEAIVDDPPISISEGGLIRVGYSSELDSIRDTSIKGQERLASYEVEQREFTGIKNLKIVHNKNTGYFLDITKSNLDKVPLEYHRVQTLTNSERFITNELKEIENMIFTSTDDTFSLEYHIFNNVKEIIINSATRIQSVCELLAFLDVTSTLGVLAYENNYIKPTFNDDGIIDIKHGRHPMIEDVIGKINFIPNNLVIDNSNLIQIITGPNMSGKSTFLRQTALIIILAQIGSFVPAEYASISIVDKIFTRIGAADNIILGDSTFMVEMKEMANIINNASENSLLLLDEVGRGTSTYDGISIAWAIIEYISNKLKAKTLFATHYQELTSLSERLDNVENYSIKVDETSQGIVFLYQIIKGSTSKSFGIEVAKLAGLPDSIVKRAYTVLGAIEASSSFEINEDRLEKQIDFSTHQKNIFINYIKNININELTPIEALKELYSLKESAKMIEDNYD